MENLIQILDRLADIFEEKQNELSKSQQKALSVESKNRGYLSLLKEQGLKIEKLELALKELKIATREWNDLYIQEVEQNKHLKECVEKLQEQNAQLSAQVEKHLQEKSNGNWAREGAVVWDSEYKLKGVLLKHPNDNELHFVCFAPNSGIKDWPFPENSRGVEPYKGQDKEEVQDVIFENTIEVGEIWQSNEHENRVVLITQIDNIDESTQELKVMNLKTWERAEKGTTQFLRGDYLLKKFTKKDLD